MSVILSDELEVAQTQSLADKHERCAERDPCVRPVRVCYVIDRLRVAGTETQLLKLIAGLDRSRVLPYLCLLNGEDALSRSLEPTNCPVMRLGVSSLHHPSTLLRAAQFARFLRAQRIDIVQTHFQDSTYFAAPAARLAGVRRIVLTRRDLGFWMRRVDRWLLPLFHRMSAATIANCEACRQSVIEQEHSRPDRVFVLENGIDLERLLAIPAPAARAAIDWPVIGMVANLRPVKGPDVFIHAAGRIAQKHPNARLQMAGTGDEQSAQQLIHECGLDGRLELRGSVRDVPAFLAELDIAVLTSHSEGLSNALLEYMGAARPIVATAVGAAEELIDDGVHGLLVPPGDPTAVAAAIVRLLRDPEFAAALGEAARKRVRHRYSTAAMVRRHEDFYQRLVNDNLLAHSPAAVSPA